MMIRLETACANECAEKRAPKHDCAPSARGHFPGDVVDDRASDHDREHVCRKIMVEKQLRIHQQRQASSERKQGVIAARLTCRSIKKKGKK
jgi:hypothetical protein